MPDKLDKAAKAEQELTEKFSAFDRAMQRAFRGIVPRPQRHKLLKQAVTRAEREGRS